MQRFGVGSIISLSLGVTVVTTLARCEIRTRQAPSVLVIAVEGLGPEALNCDADTSTTSALCEESVRFSHAYAPSTMSVATIASLLTGLYPVETSVRANGTDFLSARFQTVGEAALAKDYRTAFFSGGPPVWRKSGFAQGFEVFDDQVELAPGQLYRPVGEVFRLFRRWVGHEVGQLPFLSFCYLADTQFPQVTTRNEEGEARETNAAGQLEEVNFALNELVHWLKSQRRWNSTHLVVLGLSGLSLIDPAPLALKSSAVQVGLFVKPARMERDNVIQWAIDRAVSLVDVGTTIFAWLETPAPKSALGDAAPQSLVSALDKPEPDWDEDRLILSESAWARWLSEGKETEGVRWAIRQSQFLYIHDQPPLVYNTLTDRNETMPLKWNDPLWSSLSTDVTEFINKNNLKSYAADTSRWTETLNQARLLWAHPTPTNTSIRGDEYHLPTAWNLGRALERRDWHLVKKIATHLKDDFGVAIARRQLGEPIPSATIKNPCLRLILFDKGGRSECGDEKILAFMAWKSARAQDAKFAAQERLKSLMVPYNLDQEIGRANYLNGLRWDVRRDLPGAPQAVDFVLPSPAFVRE